jgi:hypothetical protein
MKSRPWLSVMATLPPLTAQASSAEPPSLSHLPELTEEIELAAADQEQPPEQANDESSLAMTANTTMNASIDPGYMQQFLAQTIDDALVLAIQQSMPRFIAQVRTQVAATVQRRLREEIKRQQSE